MIEKLCVVDHRIAIRREVWWVDVSIGNFASYQY